MTEQQQPSPQSILESIFGYQSFREGQFDVIQNIMQKHDTLVVMPTGGGKSLCYQIPALCLDGVAIVISPLISLMKDQVDQLKANGVSAAYLNSQIDWEHQKQLLLDAATGEIKLLYLSPERALSAGFLNQLSSLNVSLVAIDEAHCISQWGHDFRPEYSQLYRLKQYCPDIPWVALTATADEATRHDMQHQLQLHDPLIHISSFDRPNIRYSLVEKFKPLSQLIQFLRRYQNQSGIIYCGSRKKVEDLTERLNEFGFSALGYHAGLPSDERNRVQDAFQCDRVEIIVATVAFGMGINKPDVRFVVHYQIPRNIESYYQETGRAGRDGLPSEAMLLYDPADMRWLKSTIETIENAERRRIEQHKMLAMEAFAEAQTCRRQVLLSYFGERDSQPCGNCDVCLDPPSHFDGSVVAQKLLSCVYRVEQKFGIGHVIEVLRGSLNQRVKELGHDQISTYGIGKEHPHSYWLSVTRQLIHQGLLHQDITQSSVLRLTEFARPVLRGEQQLKLAVPKLEAQATQRKVKLAPSNYDRRLFAKLKKLRKDLADEAGLPPYVVFNDATLTEMAAQCPTTEPALLRINGVGQRKLERFGTAFLNLINNYLVDEPA